ncbi:MAG TPA: glycosyl hydrolase family 65 protein, partial [Acidimicrobiia bacterium]|nr:glycosyl hydrolase family 65 protein [Acidimicrobiia bacterium]
SMAVHARVAADLGLGQVAYEMFRTALAIDLEDVMGNARDGLHAATQGGILQAAIFGFAGLRLEGDEPVLRPHLPEAWTRIGFSFFHRGARFERELAGTQTGRRKASSSNTAKHKEDKQ